jgi:hypothetical protein
LNYGSIKYFTRNSIFNRVSKFVYLKINFNLFFFSHSVNLQNIGMSTSKFLTVRVFSWHDR